MKSLQFTKMHGLGNDFMVINATREPFDLSAAHIQKLANRRLGVGFDQLLLVEKSPQHEIDFHFRIFNADGSEVEQCGNGARCIVRFIHEQGLSQKQELLISTVKDQLRLSRDADGNITVNMGVPQFSPEQIPFIADKPDTCYRLDVDGQPIEFSVVNIGNPHAVVTVPALVADQQMACAAKLSQHSAFPQGVNVGFMQVIDAEHIRLRVYERGVGETLACGSNACAAVVVGRRNGLLNERVTVHQPGGKLLIHWQGPKSPVLMTGPAETVYQGVINL